MNEAAASPAFMEPVPFRVVAQKDKRPDCTMLTLEPLDKKQPCAFAPGQFFMFYVFGHGEVPISVSGDAATADTISFTVKNVGSVTAAISRLGKGDVVGLRGPFGRGWPMKEAKGRDVVLMAGGLGSAPLRPAVLHLLASPQDYGRVSFLYGARSPSTFLFERNLEDWAEKINVIRVVDIPEDNWGGAVGHVTDILEDIDIAPDNTIAMACGPDVMMRASAGALMVRGVATRNIYLSLERNMKCAVVHCGRCQYGPFFTCKDGPVFSFDAIERLQRIKEV